MKVLTTVRGRTERRMSAPDDHAVLGGHQLLDVAALHVKVGIAPAAYSAAPSTVRTEERSIWRSRRVFRAPSRPEIEANREFRESQLSLARAVVVAPEVRRERASESHAWGWSPCASRLAPHFAPLPHRSVRWCPSRPSYFGNIATRPCLRAICGPPSFNRRVFDEIRKQAPRAGGLRTSKSKRDFKHASIILSRARPPGDIDRSREYQINSISEK